MARRRSTRAASAGGGWMVGLVSLGLVAIPGFALGLVAGIAWQEPGLLASHLFGDTQEVTWEVAPRAEMPDVAAPPPEAAPPPPRPRVADVTRIRPEVISPGTPAARFSVQVGAFSESRAAEELARRLRSQGFPVYVTPGARAGEARWRVRVGPHGSREDADRSASRLKVEEKLPTWVVNENAAS